MKTAILLTLATLALVGSALASDWQTGKIVHHPAKVHLIPGSEDDLYYVGDSSCSRGSANSAPICWTVGHDPNVVTDAEAYTDLILVDGASFRIEKNSPTMMFGGGPQPNAILTNLVTSWSLYESAKAIDPMSHVTCDKGVCTKGAINWKVMEPTEGTFQYSLGKLRKGNVQDIEVELAPTFAPTSDSCQKPSDAYIFRAECTPTKQKGTIQR